MSALNFTNSLITLRKRKMSAGHSSTGKVLEKSGFSLISLALIDRMLILT